MLRRFTFLLVPLLATALAQAAVIKVGPGQAYTDIQAAVTAAVDGDVILVSSGIYPSFVVRMKELVVAADTGQSVFVSGGVRVGGIDMTRQVVISGMRSDTTYVATSATAQYGLRVTNSSGLVLVQDCVLSSVKYLPNHGERTAVLIENSYGVVLTRCIIDGGLPQQTSSTSHPFGYDSNPADGVFVSNSAVSLFDCTITGGFGAGVETYSPPTASYGYGGPGAHGIWAHSSFVYVGSSQVSGGHGGNMNGFGYCAFGGDGGNGVRADGSSQVIAISSMLSGGAGGLGTYASCGGICFCPTGYPGLPGVASVMLGTSTISVLPGVARRLLAPAVVREGQSAAFAYYGVAGDGVTRLSSRLGTAIYEPAALGTRVPDFAPSYRRSAVGSISTSSAVGLTQTIPIVELGAGVDSRLIFYQAQHSESVGGQLYYGPPCALLMLDGAL